MINSLAYRAYGQSAEYMHQQALSQGSVSAADTSAVKNDSEPVLGQKVIPGSEQEAFLIDKFGEKKLKELDILPCETCESRRYQDDSDDSGVSFQTPTHIAPELSGAAVMGHEMEHVVREGAKAQAEGREVVSQSVTLHNGVCPECGKVYVAGGETRTVTKAKETEDSSEQYVGNLVDLQL